MMIRLKQPDLNENKPKQRYLSSPFDVMKWMKL